MQSKQPSEQASSREPIECTSCGTFNPFNAKACAMCNFLFIQVKEPEKKAEPVPSADSASGTAGEENDLPAEKEPESKKEERPTSPSTSESIECSQCSHTNPPGSVTCAMCNFVLSMMPTKMAAPAVHEDPPPPPSPEPEEKPAKSRRRRARKEAPLDQPIPTEMSPQHIPMAPPPKTTKSCSNCHAENELEAQYCAMCQFDLQPVADRPRAKPSAPTGEIEAPGAAEGGAVPEPAPEPEPVPAPSADTASGTAGEENDLPAEPEPPEEKAEPSKPRKARPFILIIDGDYQQRESLTTFLEKKGVKWISDVGKPDEALVQAQALSVEIVLMDMKLSASISGVDAYKKFRDSPFLDDGLPVLFMSGLSPEETENKMPKNDAHVDFVPKPIDEEGLWKKIVAMTGDTFS